VDINREPIGPIFRKKKIEEHQRNIQKEQNPKARDRASITDGNEI